MATFSRGLGPRVLLLVRYHAPCECVAAPARLHVLRARFSSASRLLQKTTAATRPAAASSSSSSSSSSSKIPSPSAVRPAAAPLAGSTARLAGRPTATYAEQLAQRGRTLLYEAPSHFWFRAGCLSSASFCVSYTVYQYWTVILHPPESLYWWIPYAFGVILVFMSGMGAYFAMGAGRIVRSIEAVPAAAVAKQLLARAGQKTGQQAAGQAQAPPIYIEVATRRILPFLPPKKTLLRPDEVQLPFRMYGVFGTGEAAASAAAAAARRPMSLAERVRVERAEREARIAARKHTMDHILTAPFRDAGRAFGAAWRGIKRSFNREGFASIRLGKQNYKLDVTGGWALDNGRAMDRLLAVRPNAMKS